MLIATRADGFRVVIMRSVDDGSEYTVPVRNRTWTNHSWFRKPNNKRVVPMDATTRKPPEKQEQEIDLEYFQKIAPFERSYQVTLGPWTEGTI